MSAPADARTVVRTDHALIAPETHVVGPVPGWSGAQHVTLIAPAMGARFSMALARLEAGGAAGPPRAGAGRAVYCLEGSLTLTAGGLDHRLSPGSLAYVPPDSVHALRADTAARVVLFDKPHVGTPGAGRGRLVVTDGTAVEPQPMLGDPALRVTTLIPEAPELDLAVNLMTFDPGGARRPDVGLVEHDDPGGGVGPEGVDGVGRDVRQRAGAQAVVEALGGEGQAALEAVDGAPRARARRAGRAARPQPRQRHAEPRPHRRGDQGHVLHAGPPGDGPRHVGLRRDERVVGPHHGAGVRRGAHATAARARVTRRPVGASAAPGPWTVTPRTMVRSTRAVSVIPR